MTPPARLAALVLLAGCAAAPAPVQEADRAAAVAACASAVAAHVGKPAEAVMATWTGDGLVTVSDAGVRGAERIHACEVDASGRVAAIRHVGA